MFLFIIGLKYYQRPVQSDISQNEYRQLIFDFWCEKHKYNYFKAIFTYWGGILGIWDHFWIFNAMFRNLLHFCLTFKNLETRFNYQKHIKFYENKEREKIQEKKRLNFFEF